jgi:Ca-activated chloride channel homolog
VHAYPERCPDIFHGRPLQLVARAPGGFGGRIRISGLLDGEKQEYHVDIGGAAAGRHDAIGKLYGRMQIKDLMVRLMQADEPDCQEELKQTIIKTALKHQLVTRYTSRVAIEERVVVKDGDLVSVNVPVPAPKGWAMYATATHETLQLLAGALALFGALLLRKTSRAA